MKSSKTQHPEWALKFREQGKELRCIRGRYYLYEYHHRYDPNSKSSKKITGKCLGKITQEEGLVRSSPKQAQPLSILKEPIVLEYGASNFILSQSKRLDTLKQYFPSSWENILCLAYTRLIYQSPVKRMSEHIRNSYLSQHFNIVDLSEKKIRSLISDIGTDRKNCTDYMKEFIKEKDFLLIDATDAAYNSHKSELSQLGYNAQQNYRPQFNLLYLYSSSFSEPVYYKLTPGDIREVKALKLAIKESQAKDSTIIGDKGFYSLENIKELNKENLKYIIPLRRNSSLLDYKDLKNSERFKYLDDHVWYKKVIVEDGNIVFMYLSTTKKGIEEKDYLDRVDNKELDEYDMDGFRKKENTFGTLSLFTNRDDGAEEVYVLYKSRLHIEQSFDFLKSILKIDGPGLHSSEMLNGWMFLNHLALQFIYDIMKLTKEKELSKQVSTEDVLALFKRTYKVKINETWLLSEITGKAQQLYKKLGIDLA